MLQEQVASAADYHTVYVTYQPVIYDTDRFRR